MQNREVVRWYLMVYPNSRRGMTEGMERENARRKRAGNPLVEYFAPTFVETKEVDGRIVSTTTPLLFNYFFIHESEKEIYNIKKNEPQYNFLPRVNEKDGAYHYPYVSEEIMHTLKWIARSYEGLVPLYSADPQWLIKGDRVRITKGQFKGVEASVMSCGNSKHKEIVVFIDSWMCVPLVHVKAGEYEVIELVDRKPSENSIISNKNELSKIDTEKIAQELHAALCRFHKGEITVEDSSLAKGVMHKFSNVAAYSGIMRCKLYSLLLPAYTILGEKEKFNSLISIIQVVLPTIKAEQSLALLLVALYGCTNNSLYYDRAHELVDVWRAEGNPKKHKRVLIERLGDYDRCFGHFI